MTTTARKTHIRRVMSFHRKVLNCPKTRLHNQPAVTTLATIMMALNNAAFLFQKITPATTVGAMNVAKTSMDPNNPAVEGRDAAQRPTSNIRKASPQPASAPAAISVSGSSPNTPRIA